MARFAFVLGALSAAGPMAIDMYLPAMPNIAHDLHATQGQVEMSMMTYFVGLTLGQPFYGPLSDRLGRKGPIVAGILLYVLASAGCSLAPSAALLSTARLLQGLGAGAAIAISAAIVRDRYTGHEAARLLALRMLVLGVSPIISPIIGASIVSTLDWRWVFWVSASYGLLGSLLLFLIPETRDPQHRASMKLSNVFRIYGQLVRDARFNGAVLCLSFVQLAVSGYIAASSFVFVKINHVSPQAYGLIFATNAVGFIGCAQFTPNLMKRFKAEQILAAASAVQSITALIILILALTGHATVPLLIGPLFLFLGCYGLVGGPSVVLALRDHGAVAGTAASLLSFVQWGAAAVGSGLAAAMADGTAKPMTYVMMGGALAALLVVQTAFRRMAATAAA